jgi:class 3 adenylate cyclase/tetratricopeptide (TPR) repeat protein
LHDDIESLEAAIGALQRQRGTLGDAAVDAAVSALQSQLAAQRAGAAVQQLRQVSVLFADIVGSTSLIRQLDPEETHAVMDGALARFADIVRAHRGRVLQYAGDSLLAVFGTPAAHEDDAERAVLAGLAIGAAARTLSAQLQAARGHECFDVRVGIHTGGVLLGGGVDRDNSIRGLTVNIAARMEQTAPAGGLRISQDTWRQVRGRFDMAEQPPLLVKGSDTPLVTYLVQGPRSRRDGLAGRGVAGVSTRLVGRSPQFVQLQQAYAALCPGAGGDSGLRCITLVGDAGHGKSRLVAEFRRWTEVQPGGALWLQALASEQRSNQPYGMLRALLAAVSGELEDEPAPQARQRWLAAVTPLLRSEGDAALLGHLLGLEFAEHAEVRSLLADARQLRDRGFFHASQLLRALAAQAGPGRPLVALFDDLHWADDGTLDFIAHLSATHADLPLLLLGLTRPTLAERRPDWQPAAQQLPITPLDAHSADELVDALLAPLGGVPAQLRKILTEGAEGIPFYMEELVNMLLDQGVIASDGAAWQFHAERLQALKVPATLVGVLQARLDALPAEARALAQRASVVGYRFRDDGLAALSTVPEGALQALVDRDLVQPQDGPAGFGEFSFKHHTLHQVVYDSVLRRDKRQWHAQAARWLLGLPGSTPHDQVADHFERGDEPALALAHWQLAAETAASRYANAQALASADRALTLVPAEDLRRRHGLTLLRCRVLHLLSERKPLAGELDRLLALAQQLDDAALQTDALTRRGCYHYDGGDVVLAMDLARQAVALAPEAVPVEGARAHALLAQCLSRLGRRDEAQVESASALRLAQTAGSAQHEGIILNDMGMRADEAGDHGAAMDLYRQALERHRHVGQRSNEGGTLSNLGYAALMLGDYATAVAQFEQARELFAHTGHRQNEGITLINLGIAQLHQQQPAAALQQAHRAHRLLQAAGIRWADGAALRLIGQAALALGDIAMAVEHLAASRDLFDALGMRDLALEPMAGLALAAMQQGDNATALRQVMQMLERMDAGVSLAGTEDPMGVQLACYLVLDAANAPRAQQVIESAHAALMARSVRIGDASQRHTYLHQVPSHRGVLTAWTALNRSSSHS